MRVDFLLGLRPFPVRDHKSARDAAISLHTDTPSCMMHDGTLETLEAPRGFCCVPLLVAVLRHASSQLLGNKILRLHE